MLLRKFANFRLCFCNFYQALTLINMIIFYFLCQVIVLGSPSVPVLYISNGESAYYETSQPYQECKITSSDTTDDKMQLSFTILERKSFSEQISPNITLQYLTNILYYHNSLYKECFAALYDEYYFAFFHHLTQFEVSLRENYLDMRSILNFTDLQCHSLTNGIDKRAFYFLCQTQIYSKIFALKLSNSFQCNASSIDINQRSHLQIYYLDIPFIVFSKHSYAMRILNTDTPSLFYIFLLVKQNKFYSFIFFFDLSIPNKDSYFATQLKVNNLTDIQFLEQSTQYLYLILCYQTQGACVVQLIIPMALNEPFELSCKNAIFNLKTVENDEYFAITTYSAITSFQIYPISKFLEISLLTKYYIQSYNYTNVVIPIAFKKKLEVQLQQDDQVEAFQVDDQYYYIEALIKNNERTIFVYEKTVKSNKQEVAILKKGNFPIPFTTYIKQQHMSCKFDKRMIFVNESNIQDVYLQNQGIIILETQKEFAKKETYTLQCKIQDDFQIILNVMLINSSSLEIEQFSKSITKTDVTDQNFVDFPRNYFRGQGLTYYESHNKKYCKECIQIHNYYQERLHDFFIQVSDNERFQYAIFSSIQEEVFYLALQNSKNSTVLTCGQDQYELIHDDAELNSLIIVERFMNLAYHIASKKEYKIFVSQCSNFSEVQPKTFGVETIKDYVPILEPAKINISHFAHSYYKNQFFLVTYQVDANNGGYENYIFYGDLFFINLICFKVEIQEELIAIDVSLLYHRVLFARSKQRIYYFYLPFKIPEITNCAFLIQAFIFATAETNHTLEFQIINTPYFDATQPPGIVVITIGDQEKVDFYQLRNLRNISARPQIEHSWMPIDLIRQIGAQKPLTELLKIPTLTLKIEEKTFEFKSIGALSHYIIIDQYIYIFSNNATTDELTIFSFNLLEQSGNQLSYNTHKDSQTTLWILPKQETILNEWAIYSQPSKIMVQLAGNLSYNEENKAVIIWNNNQIFTYIPTHIIIDQGLGKQFYFNVTIYAQCLKQEVSQGLSEIITFTQFDPQISLFVNEKLVISRRNPYLDENIFVGSLWGLSLKDEQTFQNFSTLRHITLNYQTEGPDDIIDVAAQGDFLFILKSNRSISVFLMGNQTICQTKTSINAHQIVASSEVTKNQTILAVFENHNGTTIQYFRFNFSNRVIEQLQMLQIASNSMDRGKNSTPSNTVLIGQGQQDQILTIQCVKAQSIWEDDLLKVWIVSSSSQQQNLTVSIVNLSETDFFHCKLIAFENETLYFSNGNYQVYMMLFTSSIAGEGSIYHSDIRLMKSESQMAQYINQTHYVQDYGKYFAIRPFDEKSEREDNLFQYSSDCRKLPKFNNFFFIDHQVIVVCEVEQPNDTHNLALSYYHSQNFLESAIHPQFNFIREVYLFKQLDILDLQMSSNNSKVYVIIINHMGNLEYFEFSLSEQVKLDFENLTSIPIENVKYCALSFDKEANKINIFNQTCIYVVVDSLQYDELEKKIRQKSVLLIMLTVLSYIIMLCIYFDERRLMERQDLSNWKTEFA